MDSREIQPGVTNGRTTDSGQIKEEIDHTRERIDGTLEALADKLHPKHLLDEAIDYLRSPREMAGTAGKLGQTVWRQIQEHPMPALLIGAGLAWMLNEQRERRSSTGYRYSSSELNESESGSSHLGQRMKERTGEVTQAVTEKAAALGHNVREKSAELAQNVREKSSELAQTLKDKSAEQAARLKEATTHMTTQTRERASAAMHRAEDTLSYATRNYPLAAGLGFLAIGVLAGLALPHTRLEDETLGERADELKDKVREQGKQVVETAKRAATAVTQAVSDEAEKQGLTPQSLGEKIKHIASDAVQAASESAQREGLDAQNITEKVQTVAGEAKRAAQAEVGQAKDRIMPS